MITIRELGSKGIVFPKDIVKIEKYGFDESSQECFLYILQIDVSNELKLEPGNDYYGDKYLCLNLTKGIIYRDYTTSNNYRDIVEEFYGSLNDIPCIMYILEEFPVGSKLHADLPKKELEELLRIKVMCPQLFI